MNTSKAMALTISAIIAVVIMIFIIQLLLRKLKVRSEQEGRLSNSYGIWFSMLFAAASVATAKSMSVLSEAVDNIYKNVTSNVPGEVAKTASLFIGLTACWFVFVFFVAKLLSATIVGNRKDQHEIESDNISYFLIRGILVVGFVLCFSPVFEILLRAFMPDVLVPFYH